MMKTPQILQNVQHNKLKILQEKLLETYAKSKGFKDFKDLDDFLTEIKLLMTENQENNLNDYIEEDTDEDLPFRRSSIGLDYDENKFYEEATLGVFADAFDDDIMEGADIDSVMNYLGLD